LHYPPIYLHSYYKAVANYPRGYCPEAERYYSECLSLPLFPNLSEARQRIVIDAIKREL
jgi:dTDP-4-amino-4,6-dideoxygalactose transaminase